MIRGLVILAVVVLGLMAFIFRPVCVPLSAADLQGFNVPIEQRQDRDMYVKVFQRRDDGWYQCKTWLSRQLFF